MSSHDKYHQAIEAQAAKADRSGVEAGWNALSSGPFSEVAVAEVRHLLQLHGRPLVDAHLTQESVDSLSRRIQQLEDSLSEKLNGWRDSDAGQWRRPNWRRVVFAAALSAAIGFSVQIAGITMTWDRYAVLALCWILAAFGPWGIGASVRKTIAEIAEFLRLFTTTLQWIGAQRQLPAAHAALAKARYETAESASLENGGIALLNARYEWNRGRGLAAAAKNNKTEGD